METKNYIFIGIFIIAIVILGVSMNRIPVTYLDSSSLNNNTIKINYTVITGSGGNATSYDQSLNTTDNVKFNSVIANNLCYANGTNCTGSTGGNPFDQDLNTTSNVTFNKVIADVGIYSNNIQGLSIDSNSRILYGSDGTTTALDWNNADGKLYVGEEFSGTKTYIHGNADLRLSGANGYGVIANNYFIADVGIYSNNIQGISIDSNNRILYGNDGNNATFDWNNLKFPTLTTDGFLKVSGSDGTIIVDENNYISDISGLVPYTGANQTVNLGNNNLTLTGNITFTVNNSIQYNGTCTIITGGSGSRLEIC